MLSCRNHSVPVKLYVVVPKDPARKVDSASLKFANENGISILEIDPDGHGTILSAAPLSLSLGGLRQFRITDYPSRYRQPLQDAIKTFTQGNPGKGCAQVYDEIESLTRRIGKRAASITGGLKKPTAIDWDRTAWATVVDFLRLNLDIAVLGCPNLKGPLFMRISGMTDYRNDTGHKPSSIQKLMDRDFQLRTRFESAMDSLLDLINASKPMRP